MKSASIITIFAFSLIGNTLGYYNPNFSPNRTTIVHLFEWKWNDIATECTTYLGPMGFGGVQVSPVNENLKITSMNRPWWERYQPVSYKLETRSGNETEFLNMVRTCNAAGVRIYVDAILNHMTGNQTELLGTAGSNSNYATWSYPEVAYVKEDFNTGCVVDDEDDPIKARNCELYGLRDLNQTSEYVQLKLVTFLNKLIDMGVAGFRIDAAKHMWPKDLEVIYGRLHDLNSNYFPVDSRPFIYQEVIDLGGNSISRNEYTQLGRVTEFRAGIKLGITFRGLSPLNELKNWGTDFGLMASEFSLVFMENQDNQRGHGVGGGIVLTYKDQKAYKASLAFLLAHPYGTPRIMSSFAFTDSEAGPPMDSLQNILSPTINSDGTCSNEWICEHRWTAIQKMVEFRNIVKDAGLSNWVDNGRNRISFDRTSLGFIAINMDTTDFDSYTTTSLPQGTYCDVMTGGKVQNRCVGRSVTVDYNGYVTDLSIKPNDEEYVLAIHVGSSSRM